MKTQTLLITILTLTAATVFSQKRQLIGNCEGCEAVFEFKELLNEVDTLPHFLDQGVPIKLTGTIYQSDGATPAEGVILYIYHTNQDGIYPVKGNETGWARRHGYIRGWVKTGANGRYTFYTNKPETYPSRTEPAHIHPTLLEPTGHYYWLDSYLFEGDPLIKSQNTSVRGGGSNIIRLKKEGDLMVGRRDIILRKNIR